MGFGVKTAFKTTLVNCRWRRLNGHNSTRVIVPCDISLIEVGKGTYGSIRLYATGRQGRLSIGSWCSIARDVSFVMNNEHPLDHFSTFPWRAKALGCSASEAGSKGGIVVEDDVWIGYRATILDGVTIHRGGVVAAGAVVTSDVPPYTIVGGVPAKPIKRRFDEGTVSRLMKFDYSKVNREFVERNADLLYSSLDASVLENLLSGAGVGDEF